MLKFAEGMSESIFGLLRQGIQASWRSRLGGLLLKPALKGIVKRLDYTEYGGAPLLGVDGVCIIAHGSSNAKAIKNAIRVAMESVQVDLPGVIAEMVQTRTQKKRKDKMRPGILGLGMAVPDKVLTNADLEKTVDTSDEWITTRTGIKERRIAPEGMTTSELAAQAGAKALHHAGVDPEEVDLVIVATVTPEMLFPSNGLFGSKQARLHQMRAHLICRPDVLVLFTAWTLHPK